MKKFLSLVLAMIMTMSLVTISAGATEYKDLTDKDEIQYEEAVAVLNRIGVITGYDDGSFRPETELTRGAAAKIIVSLMIGPDAASALPNVSSPYPDVPASHTFAGVISYCKTAGYISGYGDGTFKPANPLTGYAFAKMLLGAIGYSSDVEGFTGSGWTMNVAKVGNVAGLFDRISFDGAAAVTRDQACQLALNTLKATMVTYGGTSIINGSTGSYTIQGTQATPITSNNRDINANIGRKDWYGGNNQGSDYLTLEFGEEHFKDLRLEHDRFDPANDDFGRPSNEWSYKKVTIGTFPLEADYTYTTQVAHLRDTDGTKEKALGLRNYDLVADGGYSIWQGWGNTGTVTAYNGGRTTLWLNGVPSDALALDNSKIADIADYTDNGTLVEVYVSNIDADWITDVVVVQTQLMEVKKVGSDYVSLDRIEPDMKVGQNSVGFNQAAIHANVEQVKDTNEDCYEVLKGLKSGDKVAVIPVSTDGGTTWEVAEVYVPETITGTLTRVDTYGYGTDDDEERGAVEITVGGTSYKIADWNKDMWNIKAEAIKATRKDVTLLMDKYGNALRANDVGATNNFMVIGNFYQALSGNKICTYVHGWDIGGEELDLNLGSSVKAARHEGQLVVYGHVIGELVYYTSNGATGDADYVLGHANSDYSKAVFDVYTNTNRQNNATLADGAADAYEIKASNVTVPLADKLVGGGWQDGTYATAAPSNKATHEATSSKPGYLGIDRHTYYYDKGVVFIYVNYDGDDEVESVEFKKGVQNVSNDELRTAIYGWPSQAAVKDEKVQAVVIKTDSSDASVNRMLYVTDTKGWKEVDKETGEKGFEVEVAMFNADGSFTPEQHIIVNKDLQIGDFATYTKVDSEKYGDNYYRVKQFTRHNTNPSVLTTTGVAKVTTDGGKTVKHLLAIDKAYPINVSVSDSNALAPNHTGANATANQSYMVGGYRGAGTDMFADVSLAEKVINTSKAEWLDATASQKYDDIDSAEDLLDLGISDIELDILLNEKPDSDGFRTAYLIVIKKVGNTGADQTEGEWYSKPNTTSAMKGVSIDISIKAKDYAAPGATAKVNVTPVIDGVAETAQTVNLTRSGDRMVGSYRFLSGTDLTRAKISFTKDAEKYSDVKVQYFNGDGATPTAITIPGATATLSSVDNGAVSFTWKTTDAASQELAVAIENVTGSPAASTTGNGSADRNYASGSIKATGTDYVKVTITDIEDLTESFSITAESDVTGAGVSITDDTAKATIIPSKTASIGINERVRFDVALDKAPTANRVESYDVTFKLTDADNKVVATLTAKGVKDTTAVPVEWAATGSVNLKVADVSFKKNTAAVYPDKVEDVQDNSIVLTFVGDTSGIDETEVVLTKAADGSEINPNRVICNGNKVTLYFDGYTLADGDVISVDANSIDVERNAIAGAATGIALFSDPLFADGVVVFVFQIEAKDDGSLSGSVKGKMTYAEAKELIPDEVPPTKTDAQKVAAAKTAVGNAAPAAVANAADDALKASIKSSVQTAVNAVDLGGVTATYGEASITTAATEEADGAGKVTVTLTSGEATDTVDVTVKINKGAV